MWLTRMTPVPFTVAPWDVLKVSISFSVTKNMIVTFKKQTRKPFDRDIQWRIQDFPEVLATILQRGPPTYDFANICQNCMKLKELGAPGGARPKFYYVDPPLISVSEISSGSRN